MASSIGKILNTAWTALSAHQHATQVAAHNISNAATEGYTRQRASLVAGVPLVTPDGVIGSGVRFAGVERYRDVLLDDAIRRETASASMFRTRHELLSRVETAFNELSESSFGAILDRFWSSWSALANDPGSASARAVVVQHGRAVATELNRLSGELDILRDDTRTRLDSAVAELNQISRSIAELNRQIVAAESGGAVAADLRDARDAALDKLAEIGPIQVTERSNGAIGVSLFGVSIVDGSTANPIAVQFDGTTTTLRTESGSTIHPTEGSVGAMLDVLNREIPSIRARLDELARAIASTVNTAHAAGTTPRGNPGGDVFDFTGNTDVPADVTQITAGNIRLAPGIDADPLNIAAGSGYIDSDGNLHYQAGANDVALAIAGLRDASDPSILDASTIGDYFTTLVQDVGLSILSASQSATVHETLAAQAENRRASVSGVSIDEEMIRLIQHQSAYSAAARVVNAVDEMMQALLAMV